MSNQVLIDRAARQFRRQALRSIDATLPVCIGLDQAGIDGKTLAAHQALGHAAPYHHLEDMAQKIAVAEAAVPVLREGRVVWNFALQAKPAKPPVGQVQVEFLAQPAFRADTVAVAHDQHSDH